MKHLAIAALAVSFALPATVSLGQDTEEPSDAERPRPVRIQGAPPPRMVPPQQGAPQQVVRGGPQYNAQPPVVQRPAFVPPTQNVNAAPAPAPVPVQQVQPGGGWRGGQDAGMRPGRGAGEVNPGAAPGGGFQRGIDGMPGRDWQRGRGDWRARIDQNNNTATAPPSAEQQPHDWQNRGRDGQGRGGEFRGRGGDWQNRGGDWQQQHRGEWRGRGGGRHWNREHWQQHRGDWSHRHRHWHRQHRHRSWWRNNFTRFAVFAGGTYYLHNNYWYPAYGYDPYFRTYVYDAPLYAYNGLAPAQVIAEVQAELQRLGYYYGYVDGTYGPQTRSALLRYQRDHGLPVSGHIDEETLWSLGFE